MNHERALTVQKAIAAPTLQQLSRDLGESVVIKAITGLLLMTADYLNVRKDFTEIQAIQVATLFIDEYGTDSLEDLALCLKRAKVGRYGTDYNRLDGQTIFLWFKQYLEEKWDEKENQIQQQKHSHDVEFAPELTDMIKTMLNEKKADAKVPRQQQSREEYLKELKKWVAYASTVDLYTMREQYTDAEKANTKPQHEMELQIINEAIDYHSENDLPF